MKPTNQSAFLSFQIKLKNTQDWLSIAKKDSRQEHPFLKSYKRICIAFPNALCSQWIKCTTIQKSEYNITEYKSFMFLGVGRGGKGEGIYWNVFCHKEQASYVLTVAVLCNCIQDGLLTIIHYRLI